MQREVGTQSVMGAQGRGVSMARVCTLWQGPASGGAGWSCDAVCRRGGMHRDGKQAAWTDKPGASRQEGAWSQGSQPGAQLDVLYPDIVQQGHVLVALG